MFLSKVFSNYEKPLILRAPQSRTNIIELDFITGPNYIENFMIRGDMNGGEVTCNQKTLKN